MFRIPLLAAVAAGAIMAASPAAAAPTPTQAEALILKPLVLTKLDDLSWGTVMATGSGDWVKVDADTGVRTFSNPAMAVPSDPGKRSRFASAGLNNSFVVLELTGPPVLTGPGDTVTVMSMVLDQNNKVLRRLTPTSQVFFVGIGGTIYIKPNQKEGVYSGTFDLTATYL